MASGTLTTNTSTTWHDLEYGKGRVVLTGTFGGGTAQVETRLASGSAVNIPDGAVTSSDIFTIDLGAPAAIRVTLAGATAPSLTWEITSQRAV
jgi:hypothetical protein